MEERSYVEVQIAPDFEEKVPAKHLQTVAESVLRHEHSSDQVTLVVTDDQGIQELNRDFLGIDAPTDVLAFSAQEGAESFVSAPGSSSYLGDVIISYPRAVAQSDEMGHSLKLEIDLLIVHGLLHLLGYDHAEEDEKGLMWATQEEILRGL